LIVPLCPRLNAAQAIGQSGANGIKFFATSELLELAKDRAWLVKMTNAINQHWHRQNARKKNLLAVVYPIIEGLITSKLRNYLAFGSQPDKKAAVIRQNIRCLIMNDLRNL
jgi:hypothetical protein